MDELTLAFDTQNHFHVYEGTLDFCSHKLTKIPGLIMLYCHSGVAQISIDFKEYTLTACSQVLIMPASTLMSIYQSADFRITLVYYPPTIMIDLRNFVEHKLFDFIRQQPHYVHPKERVRHIRMTFDSIVDIFNDKENRFREQIARNLLINFFLDLYDKVERLFDKEGYPTSTRQEELFYGFITLLHAYCTEQREVRFYAEKLCITPRYLTLIVNQITGKSAKELIDEHIVAEMKAMLVSTKLSVGEIAEALHFPDQSFFGKFFKKQTGITPREFRSK